MTQLWAADPRLTFKDTSKKYNATPFPWPPINPRASDNPQEPRGMQTDLTKKNREHMTLQSFSCRHVKKRRKRKM